MNQIWSQSIAFWLSYSTELGFSDVVDKFSYHVRVFLGFFARIYHFQKFFLNWKLSCYGLIIWGNPHIEFFCRIRVFYVVGNFDCPYSTSPKCLTLVFIIYKSVFWNWKYLFLKIFSAAVKIFITYLRF